MSGGSGPVGVAICVGGDLQQGWTPGRCIVCGDVLQVHSVIAEKVDSHECVPLCFSCGLCLVIDLGSDANADNDGSLDSIQVLAPASFLVGLISMPAMPLATRTRRGRS